MDEQEKKSFEQLHITAAEHPKALAPHVLILNIIMSVLGAIIGLELIVRTGVAPNTSIVGALFAIILSRIPLAFLQNIFSGQQFAASHRYSGYYGKRRSDVSNADRRVYRNDH